MNYIVAINGSAIFFEQHEDIARAHAKQIGGEVYQVTSLMDDEEDIIVFFGRDYVKIT